MPNSLLIFEPTKLKEDYHDNMNFSNYQRWVSIQIHKNYKFKLQACDVNQVIEILLPNLKPHSVVVIDNAPYHNVLVEKIPNSASRKEEIRQWLNKNNVQFSQNFLKVELLHLVKINKPSKIRYQIDEIFEEAGHNILRLKDVKILDEEEFNNVTIDEWRNTCK